MKNARELVTKVFPPGWDFMPEEKNKSQKFYEFILVDSGSVILSHTPCKFDPDLKRIAFSKCTIKNFLSPAQWNYNPWQGRKFSQPFHPQTYNYFDYQKAWYNTFYLQNDRYQHSWFFIFAKFIQSNHYHYGLNIGGSYLEQKLVFYHLLFTTNF
jgi:hypothetical protein